MFSRAMKTEITFLLFLPRVKLSAHCFCGRQDALVLNVRVDEYVIYCCRCCCSLKKDCSHSQLRCRTVSSQLRSHKLAHNDGDLGRFYEAMFSRLLLLSIIHHWLSWC